MPARDPLVLWGTTLLDGHHRFEICTRLKLPYTTTTIDVVDRDAAKVWIIQNQFGRRNISNFTRGELVLKLEPLLAKEAKENQRRGGGSGPSGRQNSDKPKDTKRELAKLAGVSHDTIAKVKVLQDAPEDVKEKLRKNETSINREYQKLRPKRAKAEPTHEEKITHWREHIRTMVNEAYETSQEEDTFYR